MKDKMTQDFFIDTMGNCFLCARKISLLSNQPSPVASLIDLMSPPNSNHSLRILSRYLKMDLSKVFQVKGLIPQDLLVKVINAQLKVSLCNVCASLNEKFSGLYQQLEKIQLDVMHCLELVNEQLKGALAAGKEVPEIAEYNSEEMKWALSKMKIVDVLRKEALQKCGLKLRNPVPRANVQKLTSHQVGQEQMRIKSSCKKYVEDEPIPDSFDDSEPVLDINNPKLKQEPPFPYFISSDRGNDNPDAPGRSTPEFEDEWYDDEDDNGEGEKMPMPPDPLEFLVAATSQNCTRLKSRQKWKTQQRKTHFGKPFHSNKDSKTIIPPPIKLAGTVGNPKGQCSYNQVTKKFRCKHCPKEYTEERNFQTHYMRIHLDLKFKCSACRKIFSYKHHYDSHYLEVHAGLSFSCKICEKTFPREWKLNEHNRVVHLGIQNRPFLPSQAATVIPPIRIVGKARKPQCSRDSESGLRKCKLCPLKFKSEIGFQTHYRTLHNGERYKCTVCSKLFTQPAWYKRHYYNFHVSTVNVQNS